MGLCLYMLLVQTLACSNIGIIAITICQCLNTWCLNVQTSAADIWGGVLLTNWYDFTLPKRWNILTKIGKASHQKTILISNRDSQKQFQKTISKKNFLKREKLWLILLKNKFVLDLYGLGTLLTFFYCAIWKQI